MGADTWVVSSVTAVGQPVVVGADGSWQSLVAVEAGTAEAARRDCPLVVLSVARSDSVGGGLSALREAEAAATQAATATAKRATELAFAAAPGVPIEVIVAPDVEAPEVSRLAQRADLLVVGGFGSRGQAAFSLGTVSGELARRFETAVLVPRLSPAPPQGPGGTRNPEVIVGVGRSRADVAALHAAALEARLRRWPLTVVHVVPTTHVGQRLRHEQQDAWGIVRSVPECREVPCHVEVVQGQVVGFLVGRSAARDLLVVGTRGGGTLAGLVEGSVARGVLDQAPCDVLVVPSVNGTSPSPAHARGDALQETRR
jgi:nucleotide-binding universal stress UspA family protein